MNLLSKQNSSSAKIISYSKYHLMYSFILVTMLIIFRTMALILVWKSKEFTWKLKQHYTSVFNTVRLIVCRGMSWGPVVGVRKCSVGIYDSIHSMSKGSYQFLQTKTLSIVLYNNHNRNMQQIIYFLTIKCTNLLFVSTFFYS